MTALWTAKRVLDQGVRGVIFPFVSDPELARTAAQACHYPPAGLRGSGSGPAVSTWPEAGNYYDSADTHVLVVCVVEEARALAISMKLSLRRASMSYLLEPAISPFLGAARQTRRTCSSPGNPDHRRRRAPAWQIARPPCRHRGRGLAASGAGIPVFPVGNRTWIVTIRRGTNPQTLGDCRAASRQALPLLTRKTLQPQVIQSLSSKD